VASSGEAAGACLPGGQGGGMHELVSMRRMLQACTHVWAHADLSDLPRSGACGTGCLPARLFATGLAERRCRAAPLARRPPSGQSRHRQRRSP
jgi:hypothetical protein